MTLVDDIYSDPNVASLLWFEIFMVIGDNWKWVVMTIDNSDYQQQWLCRGD